VAHEIAVTEATLMKPVGLISTGVLLLLLGAVAPTHAQQEQHEQDAKHPKQEEQGKPEKQQQDLNKQQQHAQQQQQDQNKQQQHAQQQQQDQNKQQQHAQQQQQDQNKQQQRAQQQVNRPSQQEQHGHEGEQRVAWQGDRAHNWQSEHRTWQQRGGYNGFRIPEDRYRGDFGPDHVFRIYSYPVVVVGGYPRFQYGGFWFSVVDPWPEYWSDNWYDNDDVYIDYSGDGYYMYNRRYPRDRIAVTVYVS
jgi:flagellar motor protein MotB